jgi:hypothetical protein
MSTAPDVVVRRNALRPCKGCEKPVLVAVPGPPPLCLRCRDISAPKEPEPEA